MKQKNIVKIPSAVIDNISVLYGELGKKWINDLPEFISYYEKKWGFTVGESFEQSQFNVVLNVIKNDGMSAVFKCCVPNKEFVTEVKSLVHYNGIGAVRLLENDSDKGALLIEKIKPGLSLEESSLSIEDQTAKAVSVCKKLHKPINHSKDFPTLTDWFFEFHSKIAKKFNGAYGPFSKTSIQKVDCLSSELLVSQKNTVLLHGDLHYANLLLSENNNYVCIDPKGVIGEPEFEIPLPRVNKEITQKTLLYYLDCYSEQSQFDKKRIYAWLFSKAVLAAWWTIEDSGVVSEFTQKFLAVAEVMEKRC